jgi:hypothetical protein
MAWKFCLRRRRLHLFPLWGRWSVALILSYLFIFTRVFCFTHHVVGCYDCVLLRIFNLVFRALVCSLLFSDAFANGGLLCFIFGRTSTSGGLLQWLLSQWIGRIGIVWSQCGWAARPVGKRQLIHIILKWNRFTMYWFFNRFCDSITSFFYVF